MRVLLPAGVGVEFLFELSAAEGEHPAQFLDGDAAQRLAGLREGEPEVLQRASALL
jgi:hypothetical protein